MKKKGLINSLSFVLAGALLGGMFVYFGRFQMGAINEEQSTNANSVVVESFCNLETEDQNIEKVASASAYLRFREIKESFVPSGAPAGYGEELGISFDEVQDAIDKVRVFGPTYGEADKKIILTSSDLERYKQIGFSTACKFCCGVDALVKEDGSAACGCAHSTMMRGLAAYLIKNYPEMSNEKILNELNKWRITFFPKQTLTAELQKLKDSGDSEIEKILQEFPDFMPQMVGGC